MNQLSHSASFPDFTRARSVEGTGGPIPASLRALRRHYAYLLSNLPGVVYRCEAAAPWRIQFISSKVLDLTGRRRKEFERGLGWAEIVHPDDLEAIEETVRKAVERRQQFSITYRILHVSGAVIWVREQGRAATPDSSGNQFLEGFIQDVTPERELEQSLRVAETLAGERAHTLEAVLESTTDCVYSLNEAWQPTYVNGRAKEYFGGSGELIGRSVEAAFPDDRDQVFQECLRRAMHLREPTFAEGFVASRQRWYELRVAPTPGGITVFFRDVSERRQLEEFEKAAANRWRATLDMIPQMVWSMAGGARRPDYYNDRWYEFTGLTPGSLGGPEWLDLFHPDDREQTLEQWRISRATGAPYEVEYRVRSRNGEYRWVVSRGQAETDAQGKVVRWYGTCTDVHERRLNRAALVASEQKARAILNSVPQVIWCADDKGSLEFISAQWEAFSRTSKETLSGAGWRQLVHPRDRVAAFQRWIASVRTGRPYEASFRMAHSGGRYLWTLVRAIPKRDQSGAVVRWFGTCTNIHEQVVAQEALAESEALSRGIIEASPDCISLLDAQGAVLYVNAATLEAYGLHDADSLIGTRWGYSFESGTQAKAFAALNEAKEGAVGRFVLRGGPMRNRWYDVAVAPVLGTGGAAKNFIVISRDFSERREAEEKAQWTANHDVLTALPNRFLFNQRLEQELANAEAAGGGFSLLLFDVDHLKHVNDGMGHDAGDELLKEVAKRLSASVRAGDTVSRLGGDEFAVLLPGIETKEEVQKIADLLRERLTTPFTFGGKLVDCHASIGASICPLHGRGKAELMKSADIALYVAKRFSRGQLRVFEASMRDQMQRRLSMLSLAKSALNQHRITPYYQPKIDLERGTVAGFEALLRWRDSSGRLGFPGSIEAAFEDAELASAISERMMDMVLEDVASWNHEGVRFGHVALNAGAVELRRHDFVDSLLGRLEERAISPHEIQLEVTETVFLGRGSEHIHEALQRLSDAGVQIALDDFGTGYASLSHLNKHPIDLIKIDRSFVECVGSGSTGEPIVDAVISLGQSLGIKVVAEGIENEGQARFLRSRGCQYAQGFFYSAAVPAGEVHDLVASFSIESARTQTNMASQ